MMMMMMMVVMMMMIVIVIQLVPVLSRLFNNSPSTLGRTSTLPLLSYDDDDDHDHDHDNVDMMMMRTVIMMMMTMMTLGHHSLFDTLSYTQSIP